MDAAVAVLFVIGLQGLQHPKFYPRGVPVLLDGSDDLDGNKFPSLAVFGLHDLAKRALAKQLDHLIYEIC